jgi:hypothetical protein
VCQGLRLHPLSPESATNPRLLLGVGVVAAGVGEVEEGIVVEGGVEVVEVVVGVSRMHGRHSQQQQQGVGARGHLGLVLRGATGAGGVGGGLAGGWGVVGPTRADC